jgi:hypothetical protein
MGKDHGSEYRKGDDFHRIHVATTKQDIVVERGVDNLDVNQNDFSPKLDGDILEESFGG